MIKKCMEKMKKLPRSWQLAVYKIIRDQKLDLIVISGTVAGKTLTFVLPMLDLEACNESGVFIVVSPLTELQCEQVSQISVGEQAMQLTLLKMETMQEAGLVCLTMSEAPLTDDEMKVGDSLFRVHSPCVCHRSA
jgi:superfamily II DNA helicase RecQ